MYGKSCWIGGTLTLDDLAENSEIGDWKMPDFKAASAYAVSQGWLIVEDSDGGGAGGGLNERLKRPSEPRPDPGPDRLLGRRQSENVTVVQRLVHWRRRLVCPTIIGERASPDEGLAGRIIIHAHDRILA